MFDKDLAKDFCPPRLWRGIKLLLGHEKNFSGDFRSWNEASAACGGGAYESEDCTQVAIQQAEESKAQVLERFELRPLDIRLLGTLEYCILRLNGRNVSVVDFGGGAGSHFFRFQPFIGQSIYNWTVVEIGAVVRAARSKFYEPNLNFQSNLAECAPSDVALVSCSLQYCPNPYEIVSSLVAKTQKFIIFDRLPLISGPKDRLTVQRSPKSVYSTMYPAYFFSAQKFEEYVRSLGGQIKLRWSVPEDESWLDGKRLFYSGFIVELQD